MLSITTSDSLALVESTVLKRGPSSISSCTTLLSRPLVSAWSPDNNTLYIASRTVVQRYDPSSNSIVDVYASSEDICTLVCRDKASVLFASAAKIHLLDGGSISKTFDSHKANITSLALSSDHTLLASTASDGVHVHNLTLGSHTVLQGLPPTNPIAACAFHPHSRTRLLLGTGKQLLIYDTTKPSGPVKIVSLNDISTLGDIKVVACSPFSKTLVAVCTTAGTVGLIDLDKEKGLFRTLNVKVPLTAMAFSPEGAAIYLGTESGKILVLDLRALDKPPKTTIVSESSSRVETITVQGKPKASSEPPAKVPATKAPAPASSAKPVSAGARPTGPAKVARVGSGTTPSTPGRRVPAAKTTSLKQGVSPPRKKVFSPARDPLGNSASTNDISVSLGSIGGELKRKATKELPPRTPKKPAGAESVSTAGARKLRASPGSSPKDHSPNQPRVLATRTRKTSTTGAGDTASVPSKRTVSSVTKTGPPSLLRTTGRARSPAPPVPSVHASNHERTSSSASRASGVTVSSGRTLVAPKPHTVSGTSVRSQTSSVASVPRSRMASPPARTPSPDFSDVAVDPVTHVVPKKKAMGALGLGTPEVNRWISMGAQDENPKAGDKGKGKNVGFQDDVDDSSDEELVGDTAPQDDGPAGLHEGDRSLSMQISPRRPPPLRSSTNTWAPSPLRNMSSSAGGGSGGTAQDFLRNIVRDIMYDYQQETRAEIMGVHLDLVRMGRGWKKDLREIMDEYVGDLKDLREENRQLREENERLKRGY